MGGGQRPSGRRADAISSFASAYDDHIWDVYGFFGYRISSREEAEDLTQATFERALRAWDRFDPSRASVRTWLLAIAGNLLIDHFRRNRPEREQLLIADAIGRERLESDPDREFSLGLDPELAAALETLGDRQREVVALRFGGDLTGPEIAELTGLSLANVQQITSRSLRQLREELERARAGGPVSSEG